MKTSLIISTYNWPEALHLVLKSVQHQLKLPSEVIIADDGSTQDTKLVIDSYKDKISVPLRHIWHEDRGFKKAEILNKAVAQSEGEYIIQVDGDCILHRSFVKDHISFAKKNSYLYGSRVNIQESHLDTLFKNEQIDFNVLSSGIKKRTRTLHIPLFANFYKEKDTFSSKYRGCNTSFYKSDFIAINGYDENFVGWGREDSELAIRFHNNGLKARRLRYKGIVYHIYHLEKSKANLAENDSIEKRTIANKTIKSPKGVDQYLSQH
ncbi:MAG: glycosyltransferase [Winogradskyella sp.]|uniref:glycosyltransferase family 2 protein n=1 Tax=Winogradskyella sp. TaxID=1883156 RepID=UPI000F3DCB32|nr:glycosyltransferase family 2 protein [Winogradskyella sp.]RNC84895.1 MAG: glycosyltransferase [Winogradskyella sp.]